MQRCAGRLPVPVALVVSGAAEHDLIAAKQIMCNNYPVKAGRLYADKAYSDEDWRDDLQQENIQLLTPRKKLPGERTVCSDIFSSLVASARQSIESFFNWLDHHTSVQFASLVRSEKGMLAHTFGRLAAAISLILFNS